MRQPNQIEELRNAYGFMNDSTNEFKYGVTIAAGHRQQEQWEQRRLVRAAAKKLQTLTSAETKNHHKIGLATQTLKRNKLKLAKITKKWDREINNLTKVGNYLKKQKSKQYSGVNILKDCLKDIPMIIKRRNKYMNQNRATRAIIKKMPLNDPRRPALVRQITKGIRIRST